MSSVNENNITDVNDSTLLENTPMMVVEQGGMTLAIPITSTGGGVEQVQADWAQTDNTAVDFIKNKPEIPQNVSDLPDATDYAKVADVPTKVTDLSDASEYAKKSDIQQPDWSVTDSSSPAYIKNKPEIAPGVATRNIIRHEGDENAVITVLEANTLHIFTTPIKSLTITSVEYSDFPSEVQFTTYDDNKAATGFTANLSSVFKFIGGSPLFMDGVSYIINVKNCIAVVVEYE